MDKQFKINKESIINGLKSKATALAANIKDTIKENISSPYPPASNAGEPPHKRSGDLHNSITAKVATINENEVIITIESDIPYARALEFGTDKMAARPFMQSGIEQALKSFTI